MTKSELRKEVKTKNRELPLAERETLDRKIEERFFSLDMPEEKCIFSYVSFGSEVNTHKIIEKLLNQGFDVCVPLCREEGQMSAKRISSLSELAEGKYGILEPSSAAEEISPEEISLVIAPGLAFGEDCTRLGKGAGYYDRFLERAKNALVVALCREMNVYERVPCEEHDRAVDMVITEKRVIKRENREE